MASLMIAPVALPEPSPAGPARRPGSRGDVAGRRAPAGAPRTATVTPLPVRRAAPRRSALPWHFYRRRAVALVAAVIVLLAAWQLLAAVGARLVDSPATQLGGSPDVAVVLHDAEPGETLWSLAVALGPAGDVRRSLDELTRLNGGSGLVAGRPVRVPASWYPAVR